MKNIIILFILISLTSAANAQDVHFSQVQSAPLIINPSLTGIFEGNYRLIANYRNQWKGLSNPFETFAVSAELKPFEGKNNAVDLGIGLLLISDKAGDLNFRTNTNYLSVAGRFYLEKNRLVNHYISLGLQFGYQSYAVDWTKIQVEFPNAVITGLDKTGHFDASAGGTWVYATRKYVAYIGAAAYHFTNIPNSLRVNGSNALAPRYVGHLGFETELNTSTALLLNGLYQVQNDANEIIVGGRIQFGRFQNQEDASVYLGTWYRLKDALIFSMGLTLQDVAFTFSYDATTSGLSEGNNGFGALELGVLYTGNFRGKTRNNSRVKCPKL